jgi:hypothetical protein
MHHLLVVLPILSAVQAASVAALHDISKSRLSLDSKAMDPISAIGLVGTVVQLVYFSIKIIFRREEVYIWWDPVRGPQDRHPE